MKKFFLLSFLFCLGCDALYKKNWKPLIWGLVISFPFSWMFVWAILILAGVDGQRVFS